MRFLACLFLTLALGCAKAPSSLVPLCIDADRHLDDRLVGEWRLKSAKPKPERPPLISFGNFDDVIATIASDNVASYRLTLKRDDSHISLDCMLTKVGDAVYMTLRQPPIQDAAIAGTTLRPYFLTKCSFLDGEIRLTGCDGERLLAILKDSTLPFIETDSGLIFTGTTDQLRELIKHNGDTLFPAGTGDVILVPADKKAG